MPEWQEDFPVLTRFAEQFARSDCLNVGLAA